MKHNCPICKAHLTEGGQAFAFGELALEAEFFFDGAAEIESGRELLADELQRGPGFTREHGAVWADQEAANALIAACNRKQAARVCPFFAERRKLGIIQNNLGIRKFEFFL